MLHTKVLVTAVGPHMLPVLNRFSLPSFERFADRQGYSVQVVELASDAPERKSSSAKLARWQKLQVIRGALNIKFHRTAI